MLTSTYPGGRTVFAIRPVSVVLILLVHVLSLECTLICNSTGNKSHGSSGTYNNKGFIALCCPHEHLFDFVNSTCIPIGKDHRGMSVDCAPVYRSENVSVLVNESVSFITVARTKCPNNGYKLYDSEFKLLDNGMLYMEDENPKLVQDRSKYCLARKELNRYDIIFCFDDIEIISPPIGIIVSIPFLFLTFLVYTVIPELSNMHGRTLRGYVGCLCVAYLFFVILQMTPTIANTFCIFIAFTIYFSFLASFFWLNVMCFDIWWTFGGFRSLQGSVNQREQKKFIIYSIYAWGCASILTIVCAIMNFLPGDPSNLIRPEFGVDTCWFKSEQAKAVYFYGPMGVTVLCNICLFISTAMKIAQHKRTTEYHLRGVDSRRHDDNKQWFNLYLKLFIVMGITWSMEIISWLFHNSPTYIWYLTDLANALQGVIIFLIFVWKEKIRRLLLKRFRCFGHNVLSSNSSRSAYHSSASRTCTTSSLASTQMLPVSTTKITPTSALYQDTYKSYSSNAPSRTNGTKLPNDSNDCP